MTTGLVGSEMCIRDRSSRRPSLLNFLENCSHRRVPVVSLKITTSSCPARVGSGPSLARNDARLACVLANHGSNPDSSTVQLSEWNHPASVDWIQTHKRFKITLFTRTKHNMRIWILFGSCQNPIRLIYLKRFLSLPSHLFYIYFLMRWALMRK